MKHYFAMACLLWIKFAAGQTVTQVEYFLDTDAGFGKNALVTVSPSADGSFPINLSVGNVSAGFHKLYIRTKDSEGNWSLTSRKTIEVLNTAEKNIVTTGEYFFDTDPGFGAATAIAIASPDTVVMQNLSASVAGLQPGYHKLFTRVKDKYGSWSITSRHNVEVIKDTTGGLVTMVEYFFDTDPGFGNCASVTFATPSQNGTFGFTIPVGQIPASYKNLYFRVKDSGNYNWSITQWKDYAALPLTFLDFYVTRQNGNAQLTWKTTNEINTSHFNVQRSEDAVSFITIGKVTAKGAVAEINQYDYTDDLTSVANGKVYYRIEQADKDGKISYSKIASLVISSKSNYTITPNPAKDYFVVKGNRITGTQKVDLVVCDLAGHTVILQKMANAISEKVDISNLAKGMYIVKIIGASAVETHKLLVQ